MNPDDQSNKMGKITLVDFAGFQSGIENAEETGIRVRSFSVKWIPKRRVMAWWYIAALIAILLCAVLYYVFV